MIDVNVGKLAISYYSKASGITTGWPLIKGNHAHNRSVSCTQCFFKDVWLRKVLNEKRTKYATMQPAKVNNVLETLHLSHSEKIHVANEGLNLLLTNILEMFSKKKNPSSLLDVGCGDGTAAYCLGKILGIKVTGIDFESIFLQNASRKISTANLNIETQDFPFEAETFSNVTLIEVIEHLAKPERCLSEIARVLAPDGEFILATPNLGCLTNRLSILKGKDPLPIVIGHKAYDRHIRLYAKNSLEQLLSHWFEITKVSYCNPHERHSWKGIFRDALCFFDSSLKEDIMISCRKKQ